MGEEFKPNSIHAQLATIIAHQDAQRQINEDHHTAVIKRLDEGATRMDQQDKRIDSLNASRNYVLGVVGTVTGILGIAEYFHLKIH